MEARIARLESDVAHLRTDVADIKVDVRSLRDKMDTMYTKLSEKIEGGEHRLDAKIDKLAGSLASTARWAVALYVALAATMFGTMARGFGWI
jgi:outer membrane murein-binding lipoprotein Lpp